MRATYILAIALIASCIMLNANLHRALAAEYFFDSQIGSDENQGNSPETAFRTLEKLRYLNLGPGDVVRFKRGCEFRGRLSFYGDGVENNPIHLTSYGYGSKPEILGSIRPTEWEHHAGGVYKQVIPIAEFIGKKTVYSVYEYDAREVPTRLLSDDSIPIEPGRFFFDQLTSTVYLITSDGLPPCQHRIEVSVMEQLLDLTNRSWIEIDNIAFLFGNCRHIVIRNSSNITISNCASLFVGFYGNPNIFIIDDSEHVKIMDCFLYENYSNGVFISTGSSRCVVSGCTIVKCKYNDGVTIHQGGGGEHAGDYNIVENNVIGLCNEESIDITSGDYHIIRGNICYGNGNPGIIVGHDSDHNLIQNNICFDNERAGIYIAGNELEGAEGYNQVIQNLVYNNGFPGLEIQAKNTKVLNNTIVDSLERVGVRITSQGEGLEFRNNMIITLDPAIPSHLLQFISCTPADFAVELSHNLFFHKGDQVTPDSFFPAGHVIVTGESHYNFTVAGFVDEYGTGEASFLAGPEFTNIADLYYFLASDSPGVDAGTDVGLPFAGNAPDLGWKEVGSESTAPEYPLLMIDGEDDDDAIIELWGKDWEENNPPLVCAGGPYEVDEGSFLLVTATGSDPDGEQLTYAWDLNNDGIFEEPGQTVLFPAGNLDGPVTRFITAQVTDTGGLTAAARAIVEVHNAEPIIEQINTPIYPVDIMEDQPININATFTDPGLHDTHTAIWDWGDDTIVTAGEVNQLEYTVNGSHTYEEPGVYTVILTVTDDSGVSDESAFQYVVVYDPDGGFVTGGGWIMSPVDALVEDPTLTGKANFGFVSKYKKGASVPIGQTQFNFKVAELNFHSDSYEWLVVAHHKAQYKGVGTINGEGNYGFKLFAIDKDLTPSTDVDLFRIKIWNKDSGDAVVYDNQMGEVEDGEHATAIGGGNIKIHSGKSKAPERPSEFALLQNYPNSFNPDTWIPYQLAEDTDLIIRIYSISGQMVRALSLGHKPAGFYITKDKAAYWDGKNEAGERVSSGVYFYTIQAGEFTATKKMVVAK